MPDSDQPTPVDWARLESLRYAVNDEAAQYIAIMRVFTAVTAGLLSDQSAAEVASRLAEADLDLDVDTVDARLSYLVEHGSCSEARTGERKDGPNAERCRSQEARQVTCEDRVGATRSGEIGGGEVDRYRATDRQHHSQNEPTLFDDDTR